MQKLSLKQIKIKNIKAPRQAKNYGNRTDAISTPFWAHLAGAQRPFLLARCFITQIGLQMKHKIFRKKQYAKVITEIN